MIKTINHSPLKYQLPLAESSELAILPITAWVHQSEAFFNPGISITHNLRDIHAQGYVSGPRDALILWANTLSKDRASPWRWSALGADVLPRAAAPIIQDPHGHLTALEFRPARGLDTPTIARSSLAELQSEELNLELDAATMALWEQCRGELADREFSWTLLSVAFLDEGSGRAIPPTPWAARASSPHGGPNPGQGFAGSASSFMDLIHARFLAETERALLSHAAPSASASATRGKFPSL